MTNFHVKICVYCNRGKTRKSTNISINTLKANWTVQPRISNILRSRSPKRIHRRYCYRSLKNVDLMNTILSIEVLQCIVIHVSCPLQNPPRVESKHNLNFLQDVFRSLFSSFQAIFKYLYYYIQCRCMYYIHVNLNINLKTWLGSTGPFSLFSKTVPKRPGNVNFRIH